MTETWTSGDVTLICGDCLEVMREMGAGSVDAVITDPPYGLGKRNTGGVDRDEQSAGAHRDTRMANRRAA